MNDDYIYRVVRDSYTRLYRVQRKHDRYLNWEDASYEAHLFKWSAIWEAKRLYELTEALKKRTDNDS